MGRRLFFFRIELQLQGCAMPTLNSGSSSRRFTLLLVHAHPDDECSGTGGLIIRCAEAGHTTVLITCTNDDRGQVNGLSLRPEESADAAADPSRLAGLSPWWVKKIYHTAWARSRMLRSWRWMRRLGRKTPLDDPKFDETKFGTPDEEITTRIDVQSVRRKKWRALFTHESQLGNNFFWWFFRLAGRWLFPDESFVLVRSEAPSLSRKSCIFEGL